MSSLNFFFSLPFYSYYPERGSLFQTPSLFSPNSFSHFFLISFSNPIIDRHLSCLVWQLISFHFIYLKSVVGLTSWNLTHTAILIYLREVEICWRFVGFSSNDFKLWWSPDILFPRSTYKTIQCKSTFFTLIVFDRYWYDSGLII